MEDNKLYPEQKEELTTAGEESANWKEEQAASSAATGVAQEEQAASSAATGAAQEEQIASSAATGAAQEEQAPSSAATGADQEEQTASSAASGLSQETPVLDVRFGEQPDTAGMTEDHHNEAHQRRRCRHSLRELCAYFNNGDQAVRPASITITRIPRRIRTTVIRMNSPVRAVLTE